MKLMIASDLHGSAYCTEKLMEAFGAEAPDRLLLLGDCALLEWGGLTLYATHGHLWDETNPPPMARGTVLLNGHFHVPACSPHEDFLYLNPGSTSIPKDGSVGGYMVLEDRTFTWKDLDGGVYRAYTVQ